MKTQENLENIECLYCEIVPSFFANHCIGMGIAHVFIMLASLEFAYFGAPRSAQSLFMTLHFFAISAASYISAGYNNVLNKHGFALNFSVSVQTK
jgi:hypothetical protein